jgi:hypothetical protein
LKSFLSESAKRKRMNVGLHDRIRLILVICNIARCQFFSENLEARRIYERNVRELLESDTYELLWRSVR